MITDAIRPVAGEELSFVASTTANPELPLLPFYAVYDQKYTVLFRCLFRERMGFEGNGVPENDGRTETFGGAYDRFIQDWGDAT